MTPNVSMATAVRKAKLVKRSASGAQTVVLMLPPMALTQTLSRLQRFNQFGSLASLVPTGEAIIVHSISARWARTGQVLAACLILQIILYNNFHVW